MRVRFVNDLLLALYAASYQEQYCYLDLTDLPNFRVQEQYIFTVVLGTLQLNEQNSKVYL